MAAKGDSIPCADRSILANRRSATHSMTACQMASLFGKCRNSAPWVKFMCLAIAAVVISLGFCEPASATTDSTVTARRSSAGRCFGWVSTSTPCKIVIDYYPTTRRQLKQEKTRRTRQYLASAMGLTCFIFRFLRRPHKEVTHFLSIDRSDRNSNSLYSLNGKKLGNTALWAYAPEIPAGCGIIPGRAWGSIGL